MSGWLSMSAALVVGALLSVSGATLQGVFRNPLAEPYLLGLVGGGALFAALATVTGLTAHGSFVLPAASFAGSCAALALVLVVAALAARTRRRTGSDAQLRSSFSTVVVAGFAVGGFMGSLDMLVLSYANPEDFTAISKWLYGSLDRVNAKSLAAGAAVLAVAFAGLTLLRRRLNVMELGRDEAECLGVDTRTTVLLAVGIVSLATAVAVALAGAVGFVGLVAPHAARRVVGGRTELLLPMAAAAGGGFLALAQLVARLLPGEVPAGVVCAVFGTPFFLVLLAFQRGEGRDV